jgi:hypothetical protein
MGIRAQHDVATAAMAATPVEVQGRNAHVKRDEELTESTRTRRNAGKATQTLSHWLILDGVITAFGTEVDIVLSSLMNRNRR